MTINAQNYDWQQLNAEIRRSGDDIVIDNCLGERFIGCGLSEKRIKINGTPGNALGAYMNGGTIITSGNVQDAVGDTMNEGKIIVNGCAGDALGYAMRGGSIFVKKDAGYRTGIHMKEYEDKRPCIIIGGKTGSFLGEYLAGGVIVVLGLYEKGAPISNFTGMGMHGGEIWIRCETPPANLPKQVTAELADKKALDKIEPLISEFCDYFAFDKRDILKSTFFRLTPNAKNPYKQLYTLN